MSVLIDTSAFIAIGDKLDNYHSKAMKAWMDLVQSDEEILATNYTVVETIALLQRRAGKQAIAHFIDVVLPVVTVIWVDSSLHNTALISFINYGGGKNAPSLVDCISLEILKRKSIQKALVYDRHFAECGATLLGQ